MGLLLFLIVLAAIGGIWYGCSSLQYKLSRKHTTHIGWKTFGNILLLIVSPIAVVAFSLFLMTQLSLVSDQSGQGIGWLYVIYFMLQIIVIPAKVIYLTVFHFVVKKKRGKLVIDDHYKRLFS
ncbi:hypothetical protein [Mesobacillus jeotgali]|uniref:hypothetical protein n=1 Tax=Mesobacillus jeotgali TaxID=129985 RepID=UPI0009A881C0|nr:hypothetical protein [Mesobacillus jeotgali]